MSKWPAQFLSASVVFTLVCCQAAEGVLLDPTTSTDNTAKALHSVDSTDTIESVEATRDFTGSTSPHTSSTDSSANDECTFEPQPEWEQVVQYERFERGDAIAPSPNGGAYVAGTTSAGMWLGEFSSSGELVWSREFDHTAFGVTRTNGLSTDSDGNLVLVGSIVALERDDGKPTTDIWVQKFDATGESLWRYVYDGGRHERGNDVTVDPDANVYVLGTVETATATWPFLRKYDADGGEQWTSSPAFGFRYPQAVAFNEVTQELVVGGRERTDPLAEDGTAKVWLYDTQGAPTEAIDFGVGLDDRVNAVSVRPGGGLFVAGTHRGTDDKFSSSWLSALSQTHDEEWAVAHHRQETTLDIRSLAVGPSGDVLVGGFTGLDEQIDMWIARYSSDGTLLWEGAGGCPGTERISGVLIRSDETAWATGWISDEFEMHDLWVGKF